jgi:hypothetical protein
MSAPHFTVDISFVLKHKKGSRNEVHATVSGTRGDLGQLAPRKKLLKSFAEFPEDF